MRPDDPPPSPPIMFPYPEADHDNRTDRAFLLAVTGQAGADPAHLLSPLLGATGPACRLGFWYSGVSPGSQLHLRVLQAGTELDDIVVGEGPSQDWARADISLDVIGSYRLELVMQYQLPLRPLTAIDQISFTDCDAQNPPSAQLSCDFEVNSCSWEQVVGGDEADWVRTNAGVWYENTGPGYDHTTGTGYYVYFSSHGHQAGDRAVLTSPPLEAAPASCLLMWLHLYGEDLDTVRVVVELSGGQRTELWRQSGTRGNLWHQAVILVPAAAAGFRLQLEAVAAMSESGHVAVDDIEWREGESCPASALCDFQVGLCGWSPGKGEQNTWNLTSNGTGNTANGPRYEIFDNAGFTLQ